MANPYVIVGGELNIVSGARALVVLKDLKPPKPPIRQLPLPRVLIPGLKRGA
jgi:hypothetical protein